MFQIPVQWFGTLFPFREDLSWDFCYSWRTLAKGPVSHSISPEAWSIRKTYSRRLCPSSLVHERPRREQHRHRMCRRTGGKSTSAWPGPACSKLESAKVPSSLISSSFTNRGATSADHVPKSSKSIANKRTGIPTDGMDSKNDDFFVHSLCQCPSSYIVPNYSNILRNSAHMICDRMLKH